MSAAGRQDTSHVFPVSELTTGHPPVDLEVLTFEGALTPIPYFQLSH